MVFAIDIDGTLLNSRGTLSPAVKKSLCEAQKKGHQVVLVSGRPLCGVLPWAKHIGLTGYVVASTGAVVHNLTTHDTITAKPVTTPVVLELLEFAKKTSSLASLHTKHRVFRFMYNRPFTKGTLPEECDGWSTFLTRQKFGKVPYEHVIFQVAIRGDANQANRFAPVFKRRFGKTHDVVVSTRVYLDTTAKNVSKFNAIKRILQIQNTPLEDLVVFGDSDNDVSMLSNAIYSYAMGNATSKAKVAAKKVIGSSDTNALADVINALV